MEAKKTISNSFTVNTVEDGENAFEVGLDRTSIGVECDTEGNISETVSFLVTISAHYGSENVVGACTITDDHEDVDSDISVEYAPSPSHTGEPWVAKITFTEGNALASMLNIAFTVFHPTYGTRVISLSLNRIVMGKDGRNSIRLDLNNENDTMLYDGAGNLLSGSVSTMATLYDGGTDVSSSASFSIQGYSGMDSTKVSISGRTVTVSGMTKDSGYVDIRASYNGNHYTHRFTLKKIVGVDKFDIVVSPNAISINTSDTTFADTPISVQVYRTPSNGGARQLVSWENVQGTYNAFGLVLAVKDSENNSLVETTSGPSVTTRTFNFSATQAQNVDITDVTVLLGKRFAPQTPITQDMETIPVSHVRNGQDGTGANAVRIDLSNEMDSIPTDVDGKVLSTVYLSTDARIYNGATPETSGVNAVSVGRIANIQGTVNGSVPPVSNLTDGLGNVRWTIPANTVLTADKYRAQIQFQVNNIPYFAYFTATVVKSGEEGVSPEILSLLPSPNQIIFSKDSSGTIPSTSKTLSLKIKKTIGNTTEVKDVDQSGLTIRYSTVAMPATVSDGTAWSGDISIQSTVTYSNVYIAAFDGNTLVDTETIPIIKDGVDGVDYTIQSSIESIKIPSNQTSTSKAVTFKFYSKTGGAEKQAFRTYYTIYRRANNGVYSKVSPESATKASEVTVTINNISVAYNAIVVYIWGEDYTSYYDGMRPETQAPKPYLTKLEIPIIKDGNDGQDGQDGERGKTGRFFYYSGFDWDASNVDDSFVVNDAQVPYFSKAGSNGDKYYVFNREETPSGGEMTMAQMAAETTIDGQIQWNEAPWEVMTDDFKYLITKAIFGDYAEFGSFIINGDWLFSKLGQWLGNTTTDNGKVNYYSFNNGSISYVKNSPIYGYVNANNPSQSSENVYNNTANANDEIYYPIAIGSYLNLVSGTMYYLQLRCVKCKVYLCYENYEVELQQFPTEQQEGGLVVDSEYPYYIGSWLFQVKQNGQYLIKVVRDDASESYRPSNTVTWITVDKKFFRPKFAVNGYNGKMTANDISADGAFNGAARLTSLSVYYEANEDGKRGDANFGGRTTIERPYLPPDYAGDRSATDSDLAKALWLPFYKKVEIFKKDSNGVIQPYKFGYIELEESTGYLKFTPILS